MGAVSDRLPRFASVRWPDHNGNSLVQSCGLEQPDENNAQIRHVDDVTYR
jgi:hypothetical protein